MSSGPARRRAAQGEAPGFAVLGAIFLVATLILIVSVATPSLLLQGRRDREDETVWRGKQYVRAIGLYFKKNGKFPASLEDLTKAGPGGVHYLRKVYEDPMNRADGTWRAIYMAPNGQLTGSVRYHSLQEMAAEKGVVVAGNALLPGATTQQGTGQQPATAQQPGASQPTATSQQAAQPTGQGTGGLSALSSSSPGSSLSSASQPTSAPLAAVDGPVMGALVVGVGSKVKQPAVRVYEGGDTYFEWEFIWNPLTSGGQLPGAATTPAATPANSTPGTTPANSTPATGQPANNPLVPTGGLSKQ